MQPKLKNLAFLKTWLLAYQLAGIFTAGILPAGISQPGRHPPGKPLMIVLKL